MPWKECAAVDERLRPHGSIGSCCRRAKMRKILNTAVTIGDQQPDLLKQGPFMRMARICGLERDRRRSGSEGDIDDFG